MRSPLVQALVLSEPLPLTLHPAAVYLDSLAPGSRPTMEQALNAIAYLLTNGACDAMTLDWAALRYQHTAAVRSALMKKHAPATANKMLCALRRVLLEAFKLDLIQAQDYQKAVDLRSIKASKKQRGRQLKQPEITALLAACQDDKSPLGVRDAALIAILRCGLRRAEVVDLNLKDFDAATGALEIVGGKGEKDRTVYMPISAIAVVFSWLVVRGKRPGPLLHPIRKGGFIEDFKRMTPQAVLMILRKRALSASVEQFSPHDFRRTFCSDLLDAGVDIVTVQKLAGHASPVTTGKYDRRGEETKRKAMEKLDIGYTPSE
ncbi:site-specific integrase [Scytonema hofmannii FACHB-248]|uniref:Site-specific integrase n=1 Tax=Scytonema hofmannii FACHB-248 TaxID=1842502 RepID=A0ABR8GKD8_9CYAN|nr:MULTISPECIES: site-specific integrase [Nostocales]MBD2603855.1 site-specific integrase [Scytonema hofmannii FACHB-248]